MFEVHYVFGRRAEQEGLPGYHSGAIDPFVFTVSTDKSPSSWESAYALLGFFREDFIAACRAAETSSRMNPIKDRDVWIPTGYLDRPTIEVFDGEHYEELLLDGRRPNPWISTRS